MYKRQVLTIGLCFLSGFSKNPSIDAPKVTEIKIIGVDFEIMEPAISCDGKTLYFNNTNKKPDETDIFYANKICLLYTSQYGFAKHKGYGVAAHNQAIIKHGPCPIHRMSFKPLKELTTNNF